MRMALLGPQRRVGAARAAVAELIPTGRIATINAGWQEREADTGELGQVLLGRMRNLELFDRWQRVVAGDPEYEAAERSLFDLLAELQSLYAVRLRHALAAIATLQRRDELPAAQSLALADALTEVRALDDWHLRAVAEARTAFYLDVRLGERESVRQQRTEVAELAADCHGFVITGGHVGVLLHVLHLFDARRLIVETATAAADAPLITWSAGAMACSDRVVLYNDFAAAGPLDPQFYAEGLGLFPGVLPFPHPRRRLRLDDHDRIALLSRRFAPRRCLLLSDGERVEVDHEGRLDPKARTFDTLLERNA